MKHWTDGFADDDADEPLVRPYTITGGRTASERGDLTLITVMSAVPEAAAEQGRGRRKLQPEHRTILTLCARPQAVAEIASALDLPVSVAKILIGDLIDSGLLWARQPAYAWAGTGPDMAILKAVRDGLREL
ncbi:DUF742 domain-containing protein [Nonomuraea fuscirosea]|uniref:DUF742 domain-containing protein n=1 Tax=Nonomuraea fuscirosea TaxID=1291556 RepID=UPI00341B9011